MTSGEPWFRPLAGGRAGPDDVGKLTYDEDQNVWFECTFDPRTTRYLLAIAPAAD